MFGIGAQELLVIAVVALLIVGPKKLPEMARSLGKGFREFKKTADDVSDGIKSSLSENEPPLVRMGDSGAVKIGGDPLIPEGVG